MLTPSTDDRTHKRLGEVARMFLRLGFTAFGGPAAHIAMFREEAVARRSWLSDQQFLDLLGATNLIPGPNSTEMAIHLGYLRAGWAGLLAAGLSFILPAAGIVLAIAWGYERYGMLPEAGWLLYGVKPVVIAIVLQALWMLGKTALKGKLTAGAALLSLSLYFLNVNPVLALLAGGALVFIGGAISAPHGIWALARPLLPFSAAPLIPFAANLEPVRLGTLFWVFLKIGSVLYGSGYVLLAFLHSDLVSRLGWLSDQQLLDAISVGQITPGPVFTTATFIGYLLAGVPGAAVATLGIFLPSFIFVALSNPLIPRLRNSIWASRILDGVNAASLGLMAAVTLLLVQATFIDLPTILAGLVSALLLFRYRINATWLILAGAAFGLVSAVLR